MKKEISITEEIDIDYITIEEAITELEKYLWLNAKIDYDYTEYGFKTNVVYKREETDGEYEERKDIEDKRQKQKKLIEKTKEDKERVKYEELKKKFW